MHIGSSGGAPGQTSSPAFPPTFEDAAVPSPMPSSPPLFLLPSRPLHLPLMRHSNKHNNSTRQQCISSKCKRSKPYVGVIVGETAPLVSVEVILRIVAISCRWITAAGEARFMLQALNLTHGKIHAFLCLKSSIIATIYFKFV
ncbi:hypothetical protein CVT26_003370 [Gymnopilus dilepis]|uniref:Uncharacterized protein n=1 Tax=Gymnopilus dilepis TaxID=231916 RepID=A0A409VQK0_9AGAR|nr:hypothetical protein CVT26_003370 [Gymnopilus dilepis]